MATRIEKIEKHLKEIATKFNEIKKCGVDEEIMIIYIQAKTKMSKKQVKSMLFAQEEFYEKLTDKLVLEEL